MKVIGITGGIGSGKSVATEILKKHGVPVLDADTIAKEVMVKDLELREQLIEAFGSDIYEGDSLNKKLLADLIFGDKENLMKMNLIVHPKVISLLDERIADAMLNSSVVVVESALIFEAKMEEIFDYIIAITAEEETRIKRVLERDDTTVGEIKKRIDSQFPEETKTGQSDFIFHNEGSLEELEKNILFFVELIKKL